jgi:hypothetical protein
VRISSAGTVTAGKADPSGYEETGRFSAFYAEKPLGRKVVVYAAPAYARGRLVLRSLHGMLACWITARP